MANDDRAVTGDDPSFIDNVKDKIFWIGSYISDTAGEIVDKFTTNKDAVFSSWEDSWPKFELWTSEEDDLIRQGLEKTIWERVFDYAESFYQWVVVKGIDSIMWVTDKQYFRSKKDAQDATQMIQSFFDTADINAPNFETLRSDLIQDIRRKMRDWGQLSDEEILDRFDQYQKAKQWKHEENWYSQLEDINQTRVQRDLDIKLEWGEFPSNSRALDQFKSKAFGELNSILNNINDLKIAWVRLWRSQESVNEDIRRLEDYYKVMLKLAQSGIKDIYENKDALETTGWYLNVFDRAMSWLSDQDITLLQESRNRLTQEINLKNNITALKNGWVLDKIFGTAWLGLEALDSVLNTKILLGALSGRSFNPEDRDSIINALSSDLNFLSEADKSWIAYIIYTTVKNYDDIWEAIYWPAKFNKLSWINKVNNFLDGITRWWKTWRALATWTKWMLEGIAFNYWISTPVGELATADYMVANSFIDPWAENVINLLWKWLGSATSFTSMSQVRSFKASTILQLEEMKAGATDPQVIKNLDNQISMLNNIQMDQLKWVIDNIKIRLQTWMDKIAYNKIKNNSDDLVEFALKAVDEFKATWGVSYKNNGYIIEDITEAFQRKGNLQALTNDLMNSINSQSELREFNTNSLLSVLKRLSKDKELEKVFWKDIRNINVRETITQTIPLLEWLRKDIVAWKDIDTTSDSYNKITSGLQSISNAFRWESTWSTTTIKILDLLTLDSKELTIEDMKVKWINKHTTWNILYGSKYTKEQLSLLRQLIDGDFTWDKTSAANEFKSITWVDDLFDTFFEASEVRSHKVQIRLKKHYLEKWWDIKQVLRMSDTSDKFDLVSSILLWVKEWVQNNATIIHAELTPLLRRIFDNNPIGFNNFQQGIKMVFNNAQLTKTIQEAARYGWWSARERDFIRTFIINAAVTYKSLDEQWAVSKIMSLDNTKYGISKSEILARIFTSNFDFDPAMVWTYSKMIKEAGLWSVTDIIWKHISITSAEKLVSHMRKLGVSATVKPDDIFNINREINKLFSNQLFSSSLYKQITWNDSIFTAVDNIPKHNYKYIVSQLWDIAKWIDKEIFEDVDKVVRFLSKAIKEETDEVKRIELQNKLNAIDQMNVSSMIDSAVADANARLTWVTTISELREVSQFITDTLNQTMSTTGLISDKSAKTLLWFQDNYMRKMADLQWHILFDINAPQQADIIKDLANTFNKINFNYSWFFRDGKIDIDLISDSPTIVLFRDAFSFGDGQVKYTQLDPQARKILNDVFDLKWEKETWESLHERSNWDEWLFKFYLMQTNAWKFLIDTYEPKQADIRWLNVRDIMSWSKNPLDRITELNEWIHLTQLKLMAQMWYESYRGTDGTRITISGSSFTMEDLVTKYRDFLELKILEDSKMPIEIKDWQVSEYYTQMLERVFDQIDSGGVVYALWRIVWDVWTQVYEAGWIKNFFKADHIKTYRQIESAINKYIVPPNSIYAVTRNKIEKLVDNYILEKESKLRTRAWELIQDDSFSWIFHDFIRWTIHEPAYNIVDNIMEEINSYGWWLLKREITPETLLQLRELKQSLWKKGKISDNAEGINIDNKKIINDLEERYKTAFNKINKRIEDVKNKKDANKIKELKEAWVVLSDNFKTSTKEATKDTQTFLERVGVEVDNILDNIDDALKEKPLDTASVIIDNADVIAKKNELFSRFIELSKQAYNDTSMKEAFDDPNVEIALRTRMNNMLSSFMNNTWYPAVTLSWGWFRVSRAPIEWSGMTNRIFEMQWLFDFALMWKNILDNFSKWKKLGLKQILDVWQLYENIKYLHIDRKSLYNKFATNYPDLNEEGLYTLYSYVNNLEYINKKIFNQWDIRLSPSEDKDYIFNVLTTAGISDVSKFYQEMKSVQGFWDDFIWLPTGWEDRSVWFIINPTTSLLKSIREDLKISTNDVDWLIKIHETISDKHIFPDITKVTWLDVDASNFAKRFKAANAWGNSMLSKNNLILEVSISDIPLYQAMQMTSWDQNDLSMYYNNKFIFLNQDDIDFAKSIWYDQITIWEAIDLSQIKSDIPWVKTAIKDLNANDLLKAKGNVVDESNIDPIINIINEVKTLSKNIEDNIDEIITKAEEWRLLFSSLSWKWILKSMVNEALDTARSELDDMISELYNIKQIEDAKAGTSSSTKTLDELTGWQLLQDFKSKLEEIRKATDEDLIKQLQAEADIMEKQLKWIYQWNNTTDPKIPWLNNYINIIKLVRYYSKYDKDLFDIAWTHFKDVTDAKTLMDKLTWLPEQELSLVTKKLMDLLVTETTDGAWFMNRNMSKSIFEYTTGLKWKDEYGYEDIKAHIVPRGSLSKAAHTTAQEEMDKVMYQVAKHVLKNMSLKNQFLKRDRRNIEPTIQEILRNVHVVFTPKSAIKADAGHKFTDVSYTWPKPQYGWNEFNVLWARVISWEDVVEAASNSIKEKDTIKLSNQYLLSLSGDNLHIANKLQEKMLEDIEQKDLYEFDQNKILKRPETWFFNLQSASEHITSLQRKTFSTLEWMTIKWWSVKLTPTGRYKWSDGKFHNVWLNTLYLSPKYFEDIKDSLFEIDWKYYTTTFRNPIPSGYNRTVTRIDIDYQLSGRNGTMSTYDIALIKEWDQDWDHITFWLNGRWAEWYMSKLSLIDSLSRTNVSFKQEIYQWGDVTKYIDNEYRRAKEAIKAHTESGREVVWDFILTSQIDDLPSRLRGTKHSQSHTFFDTMLAASTAKANIGTVSVAEMSLAAVLASVKRWQVSPEIRTMRYWDVLVWDLVDAISWYTENAFDDLSTLLQMTLDFAKAKWAKFPEQNQWYELINNSILWKSDISQDIKDYLIREMRKIGMHIQDFKQLDIISIRDYDLSNLPPIYRWRYENVKRIINSLEGKKVTQSEIDSFMWEAFQSELMKDPNMLEHKSSFNNYFNNPQPKLDDRLELLQILGKEEYITIYNTRGFNRTQDIRPWDPQYKWLDALYSLLYEPWRHWVNTDYFSIIKDIDGKITFIKKPEFDRRWISKMIRMVESSMIEKYGWQSGNIKEAFALHLIWANDAAKLIWERPLIATQLFTLVKFGTKIWMDKFKQFTKNLWIKDETLEDIISTYKLSESGDLDFLKQITGKDNIIDALEWFDYTIEDLAWNKLLKVLDSGWYGEAIKKARALETLTDEQLNLMSQWEWSRVNEVMQITFKPEWDVVIGKRIDEPETSPTNLYKSIQYEPYNQDPDYLRVLFENMEGINFETANTQLKQLQDDRLIRNDIASVSTLKKVIKYDPELMERSSYIKDMLKPIWFISDRLAKIKDKFEQKSRSTEWISYLNNIDNQILIKSKNQIMTWEDSHLINVWVPNIEWFDAARSELIAYTKEVLEATKELNGYLNLVKYDTSKLTHTPSRSLLMDFVMEGKWWHMAAFNEAWLTTVERLTNHLNSKATQNWIFAKQWELKQIADAVFDLWNEKTKIVRSIKSNMYFGKYGTIMNLFGWVGFMINMVQAVPDFIEWLVYRSKSFNHARVNSEMRARGILKWDELIPEVAKQEWMSDTWINTPTHRFFDVMANFIPSDFRHYWRKIQVWVTDALSINDMAFYGLKRRWSTARAFDYYIDTLWYKDADSFFRAYDNWSVHDQNKFWNIVRLQATQNFQDSTWGISAVRLHQEHSFSRWYNNYWNFLQGWNTFMANKHVEWFSALHRASKSLLKWNTKEAKIHFSKFNDYVEMEIKKSLIIIAAMSKYNMIYNHNERQDWEYDIMTYLEDVNNAWAGLTAFAPIAATQSAFNKFTPEGSFMNNALILASEWLSKAGREFTLPKNLISFTSKWIRDGYTPEQITNGVMDILKNNWEGYLRYNKFSNTDGYYKDMYSANAFAIFMWANDQTSFEETMRHLNDYAKGREMNEMTPLQLFISIGTSSAYTKWLKEVIDNSSFTATNMQIEAFRNIRENDELLRNVISRWIIDERMLDYIVSNNGMLDKWWLDEIWWQITSYSAIGAGDFLEDWFGKTTYQFKKWNYDSAQAFSQQLTVSKLENKYGKEVVDAIVNNDMEWITDFIKNQAWEDLWNHLKDIIDPTKDWVNSDKLRKDLIFTAEKAWISIPTMISTLMWNYASDLQYDYKIWEEEARIQALYKFAPLLNGDMNALNDVANIYMLKRYPNEIGLIKENINWSKTITSWMRNKLLIDTLIAQAYYNGDSEASELWSRWSGLFNGLYYTMKNKDWWMTQEDAQKLVIDYLYAEEKLSELNGKVEYSTLFKSKEALFSSLLAKPEVIAELETVLSKEWFKDDPFNLVRDSLVRRLFKFDEETHGRYFDDFTEYVKEAYNRSIGQKDSYNYWNAFKPISYGRPFNMWNHTPKSMWRWKPWMQQLFPRLMDRWLNPTTTPNNLLNSWPIYPSMLWTWPKAYLDNIKRTHDGFLRDIYEQRWKNIFRRSPEFFNKVYQVSKLWVEKIWDRNLIEKSLRRRLRRPTKGLLKGLAYNPE